jgi:hypothetical protein
LYVGRQSIEEHGVFEKHPDLPAEYTLKQYRAGDPNVRVFYKYQPFRSYTISTLADQKMYLAKREQLNDPFDPFLSALAAVADHLGEPLGRDEDSDHNLRIFSNTRIFCVSEHRDNQLLWAHYADSYRGFCIGYAVYLVPNPRVLHPVQYADRIPKNIWKSGSLSPQELLEWMLLTKTTPWSYEREWRFLMAGEVDLWPTMFPVVEVIFGPGMPIEQRNALIEATRATKPEIRMAQPMVRNGRFKLEIEATELSS